MALADRVRSSLRDTDGEGRTPALAVLGLAEGDDVNVAQIRSAIRRITRLLPALLTIYIATGAVQAGVRIGFVGIGATAPLAGIAISIIATLTVMMMLRSPEGKRRASSRQVWLLTGAGAIAGAASGLPFGLDLNGGSHVTEALCGITGVAALATIVAFSPLPVMVIGFLATFIATMLIATGDTGYIPAGILLASILAPVMLAFVRSDQAELGKRVEERNDAFKASAMIEMIENSGQAWFWETDRQGQLTYASPRLAQYLGKHADDLIGVALTSLVMNGGDEDLASPHGERTISFYLSNRLGFSDLPVRAAVTGEAQWWSVTGRPIIDPLGQFRGFRGNGSDFTEKRRSEAEISRLARYDSLTGLPNRALILQTLEQSLGNARVNPAPCALMLIDLDRFKGVNDTLGHPVGDALLKLVSKRLEAVIGERGRVGRLGGDEFTVVLPVSPTEAELRALAGEIIRHLSQPYTVEGSHISIGASVGIAIGPGDGATGDALMRNADLALYAAKADGRGRLRFYEAAMHSDAQERRMIETDLRHALVENGLHMAYQPVVCAREERIVGFEALVRWDHPTRGAISPAVFVPIAEEIGLIQQIGEWVMRTACIEAARWPGNVRVAVNVSPIQFANPAFPAVVLNALAAAQLDPARLELEITEGVFLSEGLDTDAMFAKLKGIGVRLALDDFGTGYSSLGYLGMDTTAEGAETKDDLELIRSLGCSHIQGYIFGRPMRSDEAEEKLAGAISAEGYDRSRAPRIAMLRSAIVRHASRTAMVRIRNISSTGAQLEIDKPLPAESAIVLDFGEGAKIAATVRWCEGRRMGVAFDNQIDVDALTSQKVVVQRRAAAG